MYILLYRYSGLKISGSYFYKRVYLYKANV